MITVARHALFALCLVGVGGGAAWADSLETALMPGPVIEGHAKWEETCTACHKRFDKAAQTTLCLDCHKAIRDDLQRKRRFHGRLQPPRACRDCHTEHQGRTATIAPLNDQTFDHAQTDFALRGAHADPRKVECKACHQPRTKFRETPSTCHDCHKKDDRHRGRAGTACANCHTEQTWNDIRFDHGTTHYPLTGKHRDVACRACHANDRFQGVPTDCYGCHKKDDPHRGQEGPRCADCHDTPSWKHARFDHNTSRFPLLGKHAKVDCKSCHATPTFKNAPMNCLGCHKKDDAHKGSYGERCETCHGATGWKTIIFDHELATKYPLRGKHLSAPCASCHKGNLYTDATPTDCYACHRTDDRHKGRFNSRCERCHTERDWKTLLFDHDRDTAYSLKDSHRRVKCGQCHTGVLYQDTTPTTCHGCHAKDDNHEGRFSDACERCHAVRNWKTLHFDHDRHTAYPLLGKHRTATCRSCHRGILYKDKTPLDCYACHKSDDIHRRTLGSRCEQCHNSRDWKLWDFNHDTRTAFKLDGAHKRLGCRDCHTATMDERVVASPTCVACHKKDDAHENRFGPHCDRCHDTSTWHSLNPGSSGVPGVRR
ncbi:MAG: hypothetical protein NNA22_07725 [Nitrospira sp.]|nr:hypothetical protein [Nitrospira sp.]